MNKGMNNEKRDFLFKKTVKSKDVRRNGFKFINNAKMTHQPLLYGPAKPPSLIRSYFLDTIPRQQDKDAKNIIFPHCSRIPKATRDQLEVVNSSGLLLQ
ncbi:hypothetical protein RRG08_037071 [Elysia crispata]|uniref:Uncharacterized protein n=1 Tax=Elysia crispata TaxID=231223 RepID=A0AAE1DNP0_9GAST|nr:hypothetical protein RRG08_037071 [Elysia crispata]